MKLHFRPFPGLTIATTIALVILLSLGTWQYQRLQWKTALLSDIEQVSGASPFTSLSQVQAALEAGEPIDFRRIGIAGKAIPENPFFVFSSRNQDISWRVFLPVSSDGRVVFTALTTIPDGEKENYKRTSDAESEILNGYVRLARPRNRGETKSTPEKNRWFGFNPMPETHNWDADVLGNPDMRFYVDTVPGAMDANDLPARRPDIRNNHFDYMLTWYGLALVLLIMYLIIHQRAGRLRVS